MSHRENECAEYSIFIIWNFPQGLGLKVKIGSYFPCFPQMQQLHIFEDMEWATGRNLVRIPQILLVFKISTFLNMRHWKVLSLWLKQNCYSCKRSCSVTSTKIWYLSTPCKSHHRDKNPLDWILCSVAPICCISICYRNVFINSIYIYINRNIWNYMYTMEFSNSVTTYL